MKKAKPARKTVTFAGYSVSVPASWPAYDLAKDPRRCVRYDVHAVYLGSPGPDQDQDCPPGLVGRVDTISIGSVPEVPQVPGETAGGSKAPARTSPQPAASGTIVKHPDRHELVLAAIKDLQTTTTIAGHPLAGPKAVWIALWDNAADLDGTPYVTSAVWPDASRAKQYQGNKVVKVGGISLDIDADMVAGPVVRT